MLLRNGVFMEFKRIDDTKFQCLLDEDDLEDNNISLDDFFRNDTKKIHGLLDVILEEAQKSAGTTAKSYHPAHYFVRTR